MEKESTFFFLRVCSWKGKDLNLYAETESTSKLESGWEEFSVKKFIHSLRHTKILRSWRGISGRHLAILNIFRTGYAALKFLSNRLKKKKKKLPWDYSLISDTSVSELVWPSHLQWPSKWIIFFFKISHHLALSDY